MKQIKSMFFLMLWATCGLCASEDNFYLGNNEMAQFPPTCLEEDQIDYIRIRINDAVQNIREKIASQMLPDVSLLEPVFDLCNRVLVRMEAHLQEQKFVKTSTHVPDVAIMEFLNQERGRLFAELLVLQPMVAELTELVLNFGNSRQKYLFRSLTVKINSCIHEFRDLNVGVQAQQQQVRPGFSARRRLNFDNPSALVAGQFVDYKRSLSVPGSPAISFSSNEPVETPVHRNYEESESLLSEGDSSEEDSDVE